MGLISGAPAASVPSNAANPNTLGRVIGAGIGSAVAFGIGFSFGKIVVGDTDLSLKIGTVFSAALLPRHYITDPYKDNFLESFEKTRWRSLAGNVTSKVTAHAMAAWALAPVIPSVLTDPAPVAYSLLLSLGLPLAAYCYNNRAEIVQALQITKKVKVVMVVERT